MLRRLEPADLPPLTRILRETGAFTEAEVDCALELLHTILDQPRQQDYHVLVAEDNGQPVGYILYGPVPLTMGNHDIYWIATDPRVQGRGYGRLLLERVEEELRSAGARLICLETSSQGGYERTRRFYEQAGYREESRIRDFYRPGDDRITYVKRFC